jgi:hypothetical protein
MFPFFVQFVLPETIQLLGTFGGFAQFAASRAAAGCSKADEVFSPLWAGIHNLNGDSRV